MNNLNNWNMAAVPDNNAAENITHANDRIGSSIHPQPYEPYSFVDDGSVVLLAFLVALLIAMTIVLALTYYCVCRAIRTWKGSTASSHASDISESTVRSSPGDSSNETFASAHSHLTPLIP